MFDPEELARVVTALEAETGSVTPGKLADLAVLDRDPFDPATGPIADARVLAALVEGSPVHADPPWT
jgi:predicted amidohydrolase YtcJ